MSWTNVAKPNTSNYTNVNPAGKEQYDQSTITYDDATIYYDGVNPNQWSNVAKPVLVGLGDNMWSEADVAWSEAVDTWDSTGGWVKISKPV